MSLKTIGYEGARIDDFIATLKLASVDIVLDVRELPISRRKGFSKSALQAHLSEAGIEYVHLKGLGDPKAGRDAARSGDWATFRAIYGRQIKTPEARSDLERAAGLARAKVVCLLCYERSHDLCHRKIVADKLTSTLQLPVAHLGVREGLARNRGRSSNRTGVGPCEGDSARRKVAW